MKGWERGKTVEGEWERGKRQGGREERGREERKVGERVGKRENGGGREGEREERGREGGREGGRVKGWGGKRAKGGSILCDYIRCVHNLDSTHTHKHVLLSCVKPEINLGKIAHVPMQGRNNFVWEWLNLTKEDTV